MSSMRALLGISFQMVRSGGRALARERSIAFLEPWWIEVYVVLV